jgi:hypothetical protein
MDDVDRAQKQTELELKLALQNRKPEIYEIYEIYETGSCNQPKVGC